MPGGEGDDIDWWRRRRASNSRRRAWARAHAVYRPPLPERRPRLAFLFAALPLVLIGALVLSGPLLYQADSLASRVAVTTPVALAAGGDPSNPAEPPVVLPDWDKKERINLLLIGVDKREDDEYARTDTMILATIDPVAKTVGIMSLPRDLKIAIPGYPDAKLNASFILGEMDKHPGGGVGLLARTIRLNFGVPVHYFAQVDFRGFERTVDAFGGVNVDAQYPIKDDEYPTETYGYTGLYFPAGLQHLDGRSALRYARTRHDDSDFGRARRQQEVLLALRQQALDPQLLSKITPLLAIVGDSVRTDLPREQWLALAKLGQSIPRENIKSYTVQDLVWSETENGEEFLYVDWLQARARLRQMIPGLPQVTVAPTPDTRVKILVRNGTRRPQFATRSSEHLRANGFKGATVDAAFDVGARPFPASAVYDYTSKGEMGFLAARLLGLPESAVQQGVAPVPDGVDILIVLGDDAPTTPPPANRR